VRAKSVRRREKCSWLDVAKIITLGFWKGFGFHAYLRAWATRDGAGSLQSSLVAISSVIKESAQLELSRRFIKLQGDSAFQTSHGGSLIK
jgi:hypothetical protein